VGRNAAPAGVKKPGFAGPNPPIGVVPALARYSGIALRAAPSRMNGFVTIKWVKDYFLWYYSSKLIKVLIYFPLWSTLDLPAKIKIRIITR